MHDYQGFPFEGMSYELYWVFMILFWGFVIVGVVVLIRWLIVFAAGQNRDASSPSHKTPADILRERYARSEIEREEFIQRLEDLNER